MLKSELRKLRKLNATQGMLTEMKKSKKHNFFVRAQCLGPYVKIAIFKRSWLGKGIMTPCCETFINKDGKEWKSRILEEDGKEEKWSEAMLYNLPIFYWGDFNKLWMTNDAKITAKRFQKDEKKKQEGLWGIYNWQLKIREENVLKQEQKEQQPWDEDMELIPPVPKGLEEWMHRECNKTFFMVYKYKPGQKKATCTRCWNEVTVEGLKKMRRRFAQNAERS